MATLWDLTHEVGTFFGSCDGTGSVPVGNEPAGAERLERYNRSRRAMPEAHRNARPNLSVNTSGNNRS